MTVACELLRDRGSKPIWKPGSRGINSSSKQEARKNSSSSPDSWIPNKSTAFGVSELDYLILETRAWNRWDLSKSIVAQSSI